MLIRYHGSVDVVDSAGTLWRPGEMKDVPEDAAAGLLGNAHFEIDADLPPVTPEEDEV